MDYHDFAIRIHSAQEGSYVVEVEQAPVLGPGDARPQAAMEFPSDAATLQGHLDQLQEALRRSETTLVGRPRFRDMEAPEEPESHVSVQELGHVLFEAAFPDEVRSCYESSLRQAKAQQRGLRIRLHVEAPELATLPWEYLYDEDRRTFVCLSPETPIVRYLKTKDPAAPIEVEGPLRILGMVAAPTTDTALPRLDVESEKRRIEQVLRPLARSITLEWLEGQTWRHLQEAMRHGPWHVFHFIGHGGFDVETDQGVLVFTKEDGREHRLPAPKVATLLTDHPPLRLVVLNACQGAQASADDLLSSTASALILGGIPAVVAMQYKISDLAAIEFSRGFYASLADGYPVDASVAEARKSMNLSMDYTVEWGTPVLHMQSSDGRLFHLKAVAEEPPAHGPVPVPVVEVATGPSPPRTGRKVLLWGGGVLVALVGLFWWLDSVLFTADDAAADRLIALSGYEIVYGSEMDELARKVLRNDRDLQEEGADSVHVRVLSLAGDSAPWRHSLELRPGFDYSVYGWCGGGCRTLEMGVFEDAETDQPADLDRSANPVLHIAASPGTGRRQIRVRMDECEEGGECLAGFGVYRRPASPATDRPESVPVQDSFDTPEQ